MSTLSDWFQEQEETEEANERQSRLDEWNRIAKMLRDLEYIKVPVRLRDKMKTWSKIAQDSGLPCGIVACPQCGKVISGYLAPDLECVCGYKFFERKEES